MGLNFHRRREHAEKEMTSLILLPSQNVDYLSHLWVEEDVLLSWRYIVSNKEMSAHAGRLENASWRQWAKIRYKLKTISPDKINWLKSNDFTHLYGPFQKNIAMSLLPPTRLKGVTSAPSDSLHLSRCNRLIGNNSEGGQPTWPSSILKTMKTMKSTKRTTAVCKSTSGRHIHFNEQVEQYQIVDDTDNIGIGWKPADRPMHLDESAIRGYETSQQVNDFKENEYWLRTGREGITRIPNVSLNSQTETQDSLCVHQCIDRNDEELPIRIAGTGEGHGMLERGYIQENVGKDISEIGTAGSKFVEHINIVSTGGSALILDIDDASSSVSTEGLSQKTISFLQLVIARLYCFINNEDAL